MKKRNFMLLIAALASAPSFGATPGAAKMGAEKMNPGSAMRTVERIGGGEFGCRSTTPHDVALAWMEHCLKLWKEKDLGWALWNLRGVFGILDSGRGDVTFEDYKGHKLDRRMLELLQRY